MQRQTKYEPLQTHLESVGIDKIEMTFHEIEQFIGSELPGSARKCRAWWSNNPSNGAMTRAWLDAGYKTEGFSMDQEFLNFSKGKSVERPRPAAPEDKAGKTHPAFFCMGGTATVSSGTDLTKPALPDWEKTTTTQGIRHK